MGRPRWLALAVALCGALAGASIVEALAALTSRSSTPVSPDHLIAAPLMLAGAICGGFLAAVLVSKDERSASGPANSTDNIVFAADITPGEPMVWQPTPLVAARSGLPEAATQPAEAALRARRIRRTIRQRGSGHHHIHSHIARPAAHH